MALCSVSHIFSARLDLDLSTVLFTGTLDFCGNGEATENVVCESCMRQKDSFSIIWFNGPLMAYRSILLLSVVQQPCV